MNRTFASCFEFRLPDDPIATERIDALQPTAGVR